MRYALRTTALLTFGALALGGLSLSAQGRGRNQADLRMSGTYDLESTRGADPRRAVEAATRSLPAGQRDRVYQSLLARLDPPQRLSISREGRVITIASDRGPRSSFEADGRLQTERGRDGRTVTNRGELAGDRVTFSSIGGDRGSDFSVTFESLNNGGNLRVTRRLDDPDLPRPVSIQSYYRRMANAPQWDVYADRDDRGAGRRGWGGSGFGSGGRMNGVPDGTRLLATLDTDLSMRNSRNGEPFTMTVRSPVEFQGARIDGIVSRIGSTRGKGMDMRIDFQRIEMRGQSSDFDALLNTIRLSDGSVLRINGDGDVREPNRGNDTIRNGAIGATVGAIVGALAGGGKGAAIGAAIGVAGGVIVSQGNESIDLHRGSEVTLTAVSGYRTR